MASNDVDAPSSLLTLTGKVEDLLLSYVSSGEGGLQSLLNLRKVCSTTKDWVDTLQPLEGRRIFRRCQVAVELSEEELQRFLETPPPSHATSLRLVQMDYLFGLTEIANWTSFVSLWSSKLESLEIDVLSFPLDAGVLKLLSSSSLCRLYCHSIKRPVGTIQFKHANNLFRLPDVLFNLDEVCVGRLQMENSLKHSFFREMSTNANLKRFYFRVKTFVECEYVRILVDAKKNDEEFQLSLNCAKVARVSSFMRLVNSIGSSSSKIRILDVKEATIRWINERVEKKVAAAFFSKVAWISSLDSWQWNPLYDDGSFLKIEQFPNLRRLNCFKGDEDILDKAEFPPKLERLCVFDHFFEPSSFPSTLTHLTLTHLVALSLDDFLYFLTSLAASCPVLHSLWIRWTCKSPREARHMKLADRHRLHAEPNNTFSKLRSLTFVGTFSPEESPHTLKRILLDGFKLNQLSLLELELSACDKRGTPLALLDSETLSSIVEGSVSKSLTCVHIEELSVKEDARGLLETFEEIAADNAKKRVETHGRRAPSTNFWFD